MYLRLLLIFLVILEQLGWGTSWQTKIEAKFQVQKSPFETQKETNLEIHPLPYPKTSIKPQISSEAALVMDLETAKILYQKNITKKMAPASLVKIMTAILILENNDLQDKVVISQNAVRTEGNKLELKAGEVVRVENLLYGLLLPSSNDAAVALAEYHSGSVSKFTDEMNKKASQLGLKNTYFKNPSGLDEEGAYTTAWDIALLAKYAIGNPTFSKIIQTKNYTFKTEAGRSKEVKNTNLLLGTSQTKAKILGIKTGQTINAGDCLVTLAEERNHRVICVVLKSQNRFQESRDLINWTFNNHTW